MKREFNLVIERDEDGYYIGSIPELPGCHTQAKSLDELQKRIIESIQLYLEVDKDKLYLKRYSKKN
ncbi:MAG: type II toxin-antitoxin system HicB family antitoxin [Candidatus Lokiarchaeota archaeon]|nr:type II toxin-antitoxin system HicB family antitoxin [Candidatus Lokiarchaeota archaeon]